MIDDELPTGYKRPFVVRLKRPNGMTFETHNCMVCELDITFWKDALKRVIESLAQYMEHRDTHLRESARAKQAALIAEADELIQAARSSDDT